jgi:peptide/nickel transport system substrate-binding protein
MKSISYVNAALFLAVLIMPMVAVFAQQQVQGPRYGGTLVIAFAGDPPTWSSTTTQSTADFVTAQIMGSLVGYQRNRVTGEIKPVPDLAESWDVSPDGLKYTFYLFRNVTWHDGTKFTSADVKFSFDNHIYPYGSTAKTYFPTIDRVETPDDYTVVFYFKKVFPPQMMTFGYFCIGVFPKHLIEKDPSMKNPIFTGEKPLIGTGPFKLKEYKRGNYIELERYANYHRKGKPYLDRIVYKIIPDPSARAIALESGEADLSQSYYTPYDAVPRLKQNPNLEVSYEGTEAMGSSFVLVNNLRRKYMNDIKVRKAMAYAIDLKEIMDKAFFGVAKEAWGPILSEWPWAYTQDCIHYDYNVAKANALLDEAGYPKGPDGVRFKISFVYETGRSEVMAMAELIYARFKQVGIDATLRPVDIATADTVVYRDFDFDLSFHSLSVGPDPQGYSRFLATESIKLSRGNTPGYSNSRVDQIFEETSKTLDQNKRAQLFKELQKIVADELPYYWLVERRLAIVWRKDFVGFPVGVWGAREHYDEIWWTKGTLPTPTTTRATTTVVAPEAVSMSTYVTVAVAAVVIIGVAVLALQRRRPTGKQAK